MSRSIADTHWHPFDEGRTLGVSGSEEGVIIRDEEYGKGVRITLERGTATAPFAITCGLAGWLVHTRFFPDETTADQAFDEMKPELERIERLIPSDNDTMPETWSRAAAALLDFVRRFP